MKKKFCNQLIKPEPPLHISSPPSPPPPPSSSSRSNWLVEHGWKKKRRRRKTQLSRTEELIIFYQSWPSKQASMQAGIDTSNREKQYKAVIESQLSISWPWIASHIYEDFKSDRCFINVRAFPRGHLTFPRRNRQRNRV